MKERKGPLSFSLSWSFTCEFSYGHAPHKGGGEREGKDEKEKGTKEIKGGLAREEYPLDCKYIIQYKRKRRKATVLTEDERQDTRQSHEQDKTRQSHNKT
jgi:hypothetical protein